MDSWSKELENREYSNNEQSIIDTVLSKQEVFIRYYPLIEYSYLLINMQFI